jgi:hypothetical protein
MNAIMVALAAYNRSDYLFVDMFFGGGFPFGFQQDHHEDEGNS